MPAPIVYVDRSDVVAGRLEELTVRMGELSEFIRANEPGLIAYVVYLNQDATEMSVVHFHRDAESLRFHFEVAAPAFRGFVELVRLKSIDVYGRPTEDLLDQLRQKARLLGDGSVSVVVHDYVAGFARLDPS